MVRWPLILHAGLTLVPSMMWIGNIHGDDSQRLVLIWIALCLEFFTNPIAWNLYGVFQKLGRHKTFFEKAFAFAPAVNIEHRTDRTGSFVTLVFGYSVVSLLYSNASSIGVNALLREAILGLIQAFALNTLYFEIGSFKLETRSINDDADNALSITDSCLRPCGCSSLANSAYGRRTRNVC